MAEPATVGDAGVVRHRLGRLAAAGDARPRPPRGARRLTVHAYFTLGVAVHEHHILLAVPLLAVAGACTAPPRALRRRLVIAALAMKCSTGSAGHRLGGAARDHGVDLSVVNSFVNIAAFVWFVSATLTPGPIVSRRNGGIAPRRSHRR